MDSAPAKIHQGKVYSCHVSPLPLSMTEKELLKVFSHYKDLCSVYISHPKAKDQYTFGFVRFSSRKSAELAVQNVKKWIDGKCLVVSHANKTKAPAVKPTPKPIDALADKYFLDIFEKTSKEVKDSKESMNSILARIQAKRLHFFSQELPTCANSLNLTETITENLDYKHWRNFFREQKNISMALMELAQKSESESESEESDEELENLGQESPGSESEAKQCRLSSQELSISKNDNDYKSEERVCVKDRIKKQEKLIKTDHLPMAKGRHRHTFIQEQDISSRSSGSFLFMEELGRLSQKNSGSESKAKQQNRGSSQELSISESDDDYKSEESEFVRDKQMILEETFKRNLTLQNHLPMGRGKGLLLSYQNLCSL